MMFAELHQFKSTQTSQRVGEYNDNFQFEGLAVLHDLILYKGLIKEGRSDGCDSSQGRQSRKK